MKKEDSVASLHCHIAKSPQSYRSGGKKRNRFFRLNSHHRMEGGGWYGAFPKKVEVMNGGGHEEANRLNRESRMLSNLLPAGEKVQGKQKKEKCRTQRTGKRNESIKGYIAE